MPAISSQPAFLAALEIVRTLRVHGHQAFLAGGCVRDLLLGRPPKDYDVATSAEPSIVLDLFPLTFAVGAHFGVVLVSMSIPSGPIDSESTLTEVATFRSDGAYSDGRRPDAVRYTQSAQEDVQRRDFTINGLLLDPEILAPELLAHLDPAHQQPEAVQPAVRAGLVDHVQGLADLDAGILRAIGNPTLRFEEDHLRMLRAVRFAARFQFEIEPATFRAIQANAASIAHVSHERVRDELTRMLTEGHARRAFELLDASGLLIHVLPEAAKLKGVQQPPEFHPEGDVWTHTLMLLEQLREHDQLRPELTLEPGSALTPTLAWGALLHDIGKPATFMPPSGPGDRIRFNGHVEVGEAIAAQILRRLRFSNEDTAQILALIHNHMRFGDVHHMKAATLKRFFRLHRFPEHLALHRMDASSSHGALDNYNYARKEYESMPEDEVRPQPLITGRELIALGFQPGPQFKAILHAVEEAQLEGRLKTPEDAMAFIETHFHLDPSNPIDPHNVP
ncbi:MAG TPA: HDIG domain-containing protein [Acidobacteriaceae bacterium]|nr:HDIG domain-containing protein [Acidobacteriaceae bacterium]